MSFKKRILSKNNIVDNLDNIMMYLNVDAYYMTDDFSKDIVKLYNEGKSEDEIKDYIIQNEKL